MCLIWQREESINLFLSRWCHKLYMWWQHYLHIGSFRSRMQRNNTMSRWKWWRSGFVWLLQWVLGSIELKLISTHPLIHGISCGTVGGVEMVCIIIMCLESILTISTLIIWAVGILSCKPCLILRLIISDIPENVCKVAPMSHIYMYYDLLYISSFTMATKHCECGRG